jgi:hypothetical protein
MPFCRRVHGYQTLPRQVTIWFCRIARKADQEAQLYSWQLLHQFDDEMLGQQQYRVVIESALMVEAAHIEQLADFSPRTRA